MEVNQPMYQPTYRVRPKENAVFDKLKCERIIQNLLNTSLANHEYNEKKSAHLCCNLSEELKKRMKEESLDRYKIICMVYMGDKRMQNIQSYARFLWDSEWDNYATYTFETPEYYVVGTVFACYYD